MASLASAGAGAAVAAYLTWVHVDPAMLSCGVGDCHTVQSSPYAAIGPIPIALLGLGMFLLVVALGIVRWLRPDLNWPVTFAVFVLVFSGMMYFAYLTYLEIAVIGAICQWCVLAAVLTLGILIAESVNLRDAIEHPPGPPS